MVQLIFEPTEDLKQIFKHTKEAKEWSNPYGLMPEMTTEMHIDFVKDSGIYIMSGNKETLPGENSTNMIAYAKEHNPQKDEDYYDNAIDAVGGDDFCEPLPVDDEMINQILEGAGFFIRINGEKWSYGTFTPTAHMAQSCKWNGMTKNLKNFLKWFQDNYPELGLTEIRMRGADRFTPYMLNNVTLTGDNEEYEAEIGIRTNTLHQTGEEDDEIVWTDPRVIA